MATKRTVSLTRPERAGEHTAPYVRSRVRSGEATVASTAGTGEDSAEENKSSGKKGPPLPPLYRGGRVGGPISAGGQESQELLDIRALVAKLTVAERTKLLTELALAEQTRTAPARDLDMWATSVGTALTAAISGRDGAGVGLIPLRRLLGTRSAWGPVESFMATVGFAELSVVERNGAYGILAELLVAHAQGIARHADLPLSAKLVANCAMSLAAVFDQAFPGYAASGLARIVLQRQVRREVQE